MPLHELIDQYCNMAKQFHSLKTEKIAELPGLQQQAKAARAQQIKNIEIKLANTLHEIYDFFAKDPASINIVNAAGDTPLHIAVKLNDKQLVRLLLRYNAELEATDQAGLTPFECALKNPDNKLAEFLAKCGANIERAKEEGTLLHGAIREGNLAKAALLLELGADFKATYERILPPPAIIPSMTSAVEKSSPHLIAIRPNIRRKENVSVFKLLADFKRSKEWWELLLNNGAGICAVLDIHSFAAANGPVVASVVNQPNLEVHTPAAPSAKQTNNMANQSSAQQVYHTDQNLHAKTLTTPYSIFDNKFLYRFAFSTKEWPASHRAEKSMSWFHNSCFTVEELQSHIRQVLVAQEDNEQKKQITQNFAVQMRAYIRVFDRVIATLPSGAAQAIAEWNNLRKQLVELEDEMMSAQVISPQSLYSQPKSLLQTIMHFLVYKRPDKLAESRQHKPGVAVIPEEIDNKIQEIEDAEIIAQRQLSRHKKS